MKFDFFYKMHFMTKISFYQKCTKNNSRQNDWYNKSRTVLVLYQNPNFGLSHGFRVYEKHYFFLIQNIYSTNIVVQNQIRDLPHRHVDHQSSLFTICCQKGIFAKKIKFQSKENKRFCQKTEFCQKRESLPEKNEKKTEFFFKKGIFVKK